MSQRENNLLTITSEDFGVNDYIRVVDAGMSRKIKLNEFAQSLVNPLIDNGFVVTGGTAGTLTNTISSNYTVQSDDQILLVDSSAGNVIITLPSASDSFDSSTDRSKEYNIKKISTDTNSVVILPESGELIDTHSSYYLASDDLPSVTIVNNGTNWFII